LPWRNNKHNGGAHCIHLRASSRTKEVEHNLRSEKTDKLQEDKAQPESVKSNPPSQRSFRWVVCRARRLTWGSSPLKLEPSCHRYQHPSGSVRVTFLYVRSRLQQPDRPTEYGDRQQIRGLATYDEKNLVLYSLLNITWHPRSRSSFSSMLPTRRSSSVRVFHRFGRVS
jgi:hypothetical protein